MKRIHNGNIEGAGIFFRLVIVMALAAFVAGLMLRLH
jgi:hypothetical protein